MSKEKGGDKKSIVLKRIHQLLFKSKEDSSPPSNNNNSNNLTINSNWSGAFIDIEGQEYKKLVTEILRKVTNQEPTNIRLQVLKEFSEVVRSYR